MNYFKKNKDQIKRGLELSILSAPISILVGLCLFLDDTFLYDTPKKQISNSLKPISITYEDRNNDGLDDKVEQYDFGELVKYAKKDSVGKIKYELEKYGIIELK